MSSIRDVAREAGVSVATVPRALSSPEKVSPASMAKVQKAIERVGYSPNMLARNFRSARSYTIVVLVPDIANPFYSQLIRSIEDRAHQKGYRSEERRVGKECRVGDACGKRKETRLELG